MTAALTASLVLVAMLVGLVAHAAADEGPDAPAGCRAVLGELFDAGLGPLGSPRNLLLASTDAEHAAEVRSDLEFGVRSGPTVTSANVACAASTSCTGCRAVAVAIEVVVVEGSPRVFAPVNLAVSANVDCHDCLSFAYARQFVLQVPDRARIGSDTRRRLAELRRQVDDVAASGAAPGQMTAQLDELARHANAAVAGALDAASAPGSRSVDAGGGV